MLCKHVVEGLELADAHEMEQLLARVGEVLAQVVVDRDAARCQLGLEDLRQQRRSRRRTCAALVEVLSAPMVVQPASMAAQIAPLLTLLHEQICAVAASGSIGDHLRLCLCGLVCQCVVVQAPLFGLLIVRETHC